MRLPSLHFVNFLILFVIEKLSFISVCFILNYLFMKSRICYQNKWLDCEQKMHDYLYDEFRYVFAKIFVDLLIFFYGLTQLIWINRRKDNKAAIINNNNKKNKKDTKLCVPSLITQLILGILLICLASISLTFGTKSISQEKDENSLILEISNLACSTIGQNEEGLDSLQQNELTPRTLYRKIFNEQCEEKPGLLTVLMKQLFDPFYQLLESINDQEKEHKEMLEFTTITLRMSKAMCQNVYLMIVSFGFYNDTVLPFTITILCCAILHFILNINWKTIQSQFSTSSPPQEMTYTITKEI